MWKTYNSRNSGSLLFRILGLYKSIPFELHNSYRTVTEPNFSVKIKSIILFSEWYMWRCYQPYGCFYIGPPWSGDNRPVSTFPVTPESINPRFLLYTRKDSEKPYTLSIDQFDTIQNAPMKKDVTLFFIIHGYLDNGDKTWVMVSTR